MSVELFLRIALGSAAVLAIICAGYDDPRWPRLIRRKVNRRRKGVLPAPSPLCERANNEYRIDRPTRGVP